MEKIEFAVEKFDLMLRAYQRSRRFGEWAKRRWFNVSPSKITLMPGESLRIRVVSTDSWDRLVESIKGEVRK